MVTFKQNNWATGQAFETQIQNKKAAFYTWGIILLIHSICQKPEEVLLFFTKFTSS